MTALASRFRNLTQIEFLFPTTHVFSNFVFLRGSRPLKTSETQNSDLGNSQFRVLSSEFSIIYFWEFSAYSVWESGDHTVPSDITHQI